jgi:hypothetical protein
MGNSRQGEAIAEQSAVLSQRVAILPAELPEGSDLKFGG